MTIKRLIEILERINELQEFKRDSAIDGEVYFTNSDQEELNDLLNIQLKELQYEY